MWGDAPRERVIHRLRRLAAPQAFTIAVTQRPPPRRADRLSGQRGANAGRSDGHQRDAGSCSSVVVGLKTLDSLTFRRVDLPGLLAGQRPYVFSLAEGPHRSTSAFGQCLQGELMPFSTLKDPVDLARAAAAFEAAWREIKLSLPDIDEGERARLAAIVVDLVPIARDEVDLAHRAVERFRS